MRHKLHRKEGRKVKFFLLALLLLAVLGGALYTYDTVEVKNPATNPTTPEAVSPKPKPQHEPRISVYPASVQQGEPALIVVEGLTDTSRVKSFTIDGRPLNVFLYDGYVSAVVGISLHARTGAMPLHLSLQDGREMTGQLVVEKRPLVTSPYNIPEKLGGNTPQSIQTLVASLSAEGRTINSLPVTASVLTTEKFRHPLEEVALEDPYGYTRVIGTFTMPHMGADFKASVGTPVYAMNKGIVRFAAFSRNYGNTVIVDHGIGIHTVYMHLSEISVAEGEQVEKSDILGFSGDTGYAEEPHLHLSVRIWEISVDPVKFIELFGERN